MKKSKTEKQKMKKNNQSSKKNKNMATKSVSKNTKKSTLQSAVTDYVIEVISSVLDESDIDSVRTALDKHQDELQKVISKNLPKQKSVHLKKVKDPNAPKRGKSSYIFFCVDKRQEIIDANPDMSAKDLIKELGRVWREDISDEEKKKYQEQSTADKTRYEEEMVDYTPPADLGFVSEKKTKKSKRVGPKRGRTAYIFFCTEQRPLLKEENPDMNTKEVTSQLGVMWKALSDKEKKPYVKLAEKDKSRYENEKNKWVDEDENEEAVEEKKVHSSKKSKKVKKGKRSSKKKTKNRKKSGYILFCQEERDGLKEENPHMSNQQITKELGSAWKALAPEEQDVYNERAAVEGSDMSE